MPIERIVAAWTEIPEARAAADHPNIAKASINCAIGSLICRDQTFSYTCRTTGRLNEDIPPANKHMIPFKVGDDECWDYITAKELLLSLIHI